MADNKDLSSMTNYGTSDFMRVLLALKENVMTSLHVAELCRIVDVATIKDASGNELYKQYRCVALNNELRTVVCFALTDLTLFAGARVLVLYCDNDISVNYKKYKCQEKNVNIESKVKHDFAYGIIIGRISI